MGTSPSREQTGGGAPAIAALVSASYRRDLGEVGAFLPSRVPLDQLPPPLHRFLEAAAELAARYPQGRGGVRRWLDETFASADPAVARAMRGLSPAESETLMTVLSCLGHTYRWDTVPPAPERFLERRIALPAGIAGPWTALAQALDQPRPGSAWSLHLCNWKMADRPGGAAYRPDEVVPGSVSVARNWLTPPDDVHLERFSLSFVLLEARGAAVLRHVVEAVDAAAQRRPDDLLSALEGLHRAIDAVTLAFSLNIRSRLVDPAVWLKMVQPTFAWSAESEGHRGIDGGPSGMQVAIIQALDAVLGIVGDSALARSARAGRWSMPARHRRFLETLDLAGPVLRRAVIESGCPELTERYNRCIGGVISFRTTHRSRGALYLRDRPEDGTPRVSTGLTIDARDDDPLAVFDRTMGERTQETRAAALPLP